VAVREAIERQQEITPELLEILERTAEDPKRLVSDEYFGDIFAMYLLARFCDYLSRCVPLTESSGGRVKRCSIG